MLVKLRTDHGTVMSQMNIEHMTYRHNFSPLPNSRIIIGDAQCPGQPSITASCHPHHADVCITTSYNVQLGITTCTVHTARESTLSG